MRKKRDCIVISFDKTTDAMAMEKLCRAGGIPGRLIPLPTQISAGCGLSFMMLPAEYKIWKKDLEKLNIPFSGIYEIIL